GTTADGRSALGNGNDGVDIGGVSDQMTVSNNTIAGNGANGVELGANARNLTLTGNDIGRPNVGGPGNKTGLPLARQDVTVQGHPISGHVTVGIDVPATTVNLVIQGNYIGTTAHNAVNSGNGTDGIAVAGLAKSVTIGGTTTGAGNTISGNLGNGIHLE